MRSSFIVVLLSLLSLVLVGCASQCVSIMPKNPISMERLGSGMFGEAKVQTPMLSEDADGRLRVVSKIMNCSNILHHL